MRATVASQPSRTLATADALPATPVWLVESLGAVGLVGLVLGVRLLERSEIGGSAAGALSGVASQLPATAVALFLVTVATLANVGLGAIAGRAVLGRPFDGMGSMVLIGLSFAILIDCVLLMVAGGLGVFVWPVILAIHAAGFAAAILRGGRLLAPTEGAAGRRRARLALALL
ncbi:MAG: hypothetical protein ACRDGJ_11815, partial [Candidatus Limnocylindria bacterium]